MGTSDPAVSQWKCKEEVDINLSSSCHEDMQEGDFYSCTKYHQLHTAATLLPGIETLVSIEEGVGWAPEAV
jgi:hypothetical protein